MWIPRRSICSASGRKEGPGRDIHRRVSSSRNRARGANGASALLDAWQPSWKATVCANPRPSAPTTPSAEAAYPEQHLSTRSPT